MKHVYFDMDGVLVDLHNVFLEETNCPIVDGLYDQTVFYSWFEQVVRENRLIYMREMPYFGQMESLAMKLVSDGHIVKILSSCTSSHLYEFAKKQKLLWLWPTKFNKLEKIFVPGAKEKGKYLKFIGPETPPDHILIDDFHIAGKGWENAGGTWVHHTEFLSTVKKLTDLGFTGLDESF